MTSIGNIIDNISKNINRVKTIAIIVLATLFISSAGLNGCNKMQADKLVEKITGLSVQNDILKLNITVQEQKILKLDSIILAKSNEIYNKNNTIDSIKKEYIRINNKYNKLEAELLKIPAEESYKFLTEVAYPYKGELKFKFNEPQVKGIHLTYTQKEVLLTSNTNLTNQVAELTQLNGLYIDQLNNVESKNKNMVDMIEDYKSINKNSNEINLHLEKRTKQLERKIIFYRTALPIGIGVGILTGILIVK